jgi:hypothetical protein
MLPMNKFFRDNLDNFSMSRFWTAIAYATCTYVMIARIDSIDWMMLTAYAGIVGGSEVAKKWINLYAPK